MRVTKRVQEYITNEIHKKYADYDKTERQKFEGYRDAVISFMNALVDKSNDALKGAFPELFEHDHNSFFSYDTWKMHNPYREEYNKKNSEKETLINKKIGEVLLQLDLGIKDKKSLDELLNNI